MNKATIAMLILPWILVNFFAGCSLKTLPEKKAQELAVQSSSPVKKTVEQNWQELLNAAKREGRVVIFNSGTFVGARQSASKAFKDKYGIDMEFISGGSAEIAQRIIRERRAGLYLVDVQIGGAASFVSWYLPENLLEPLEPSLILSQVVDPKVWFGGGLYFLDPQKQVLAFGAGVAPQYLINTDLVKTEEIKSFRDLLNPKWKGKIAMHHPLTPGAGQQNVSMIGSVILGWDVLRQFAKQEPFITRDHFQLVDWVARGKYSIAAFIQKSLAVEMVEAGAPVKILTLSDASYLGASGLLLGLNNKASHPNSAKLFINWLLSKEGQIAVYRDMGTPSARLDVPTEGMVPESIPDPKQKYVSAENIEWILKQPERDKEIASIFGPLLK